MNTPNSRSTEDIIVRDTYVAGEDKREVQRAENFLEYIDTVTEGLELLNKGIEDLDRLTIGKSVQLMKPVILSLGYSSLYSSATALENEFLNQIITQPRASLEDFMSDMNLSVDDVNQQLKGMRVSLI